MAHESPITQSISRLGSVSAAVYDDGGGIGKKRNKQRLQNEIKQGSNEAIGMYRGRRREKRQADWPNVDEL